MNYEISQGDEYTGTRYQDYFNNPLYDIPLTEMITRRLHDISSEETHCSLCNTEFNGYRLILDDNVTICYHCEINERNIFDDNYDNYDYYDDYYDWSEDEDSFDFNPYLEMGIDDGNYNERVFDQKLANAKFISNPTEDDQCMICFDYLTEISERIIQLKCCKKYVCVNDLIKWRETSYDCPHCKQRYT